MARFWSKESVEQIITIMNADQEHLALARNLTGKVFIRVFDAPDRRDICTRFTFDHGRCVDWSYESQPAPAAELRARPFRPIVDGLVRISASYATFVKLDRGDMEVADAVSSPDYRIEGNMVLLMPLMQAVDSWNRRARAVAKEY